MRIATDGVAAMVSPFGQAALAAGAALLDALAAGPADAPLARLRLAVPGRVGPEPSARRAALRRLPPGVRARLVAPAPPEPVPPSRAQAAHPRDTDAAIRAFTRRIADLTARVLVDDDGAPAWAAAAELLAWAEAGAPALPARLPADDPRPAACQLALAPLAIACAVLRAAGVLDDRSAGRIEAWLVRLAKRSAPGDPALGRGAPRVSCRLTADVGAMAVGCLTGDHEGYRRGVRRYRIGLAQMRRDGSWPEAAGFGRAALWAHARHLAALVTAAELAAAQALDLYALEIDGRSIHRAVDRLLDSLATRPATYPGAGCAGLPWPQDTDLTRAWPGIPHALAWTEPYLARFAATATGARLREQLGAGLAAARPLFDELCGGNATALFAAPASLTARA